MTPSEEAKRLRVREVEIADALSRFAVGAVEGAPCLVAQTTVVTTYPATASCYFGCRPQALLGAEVEGGTATAVPAGAIFYALNLGSAVPPAGTTVLTTFVGSRWVFRYDG
jgi:hypothetical protein